MTSRRGILGVFAAAFMAFLLLSRAMLVAPGTVVTTRNNVIFGADTRTRLALLTDAEAGGQDRRAFYRHPAYFVVWRPATRALTAIFSLVLSPSQSRVLAAQLLVCGFAALSVAVLFWLALRAGASRLRAWLLVPLGILSTVSVLLVVPDHWSIGCALLLGTFAIVSTPGPLRVRDGLWLALLAALAAGTTVTNAVFGVFAGLAYVRRMGWSRLERMAWYSMAAGAVGLIAALLLRINPIGAMANYFNYRLVNEPLQGAAYSLFALIGPIIGPVPGMSIEIDHPKLSYEPLSAVHYQPLQMLGVVVWVALLSVCAWHALRDRETRNWTLWLLSWIAFNVILHNMWGDEFFAYTPHWSWALLAIVAMKARTFKTPVLCSAVVVIATAQIYTLWTIYRLIRI